MTWTIIYGYNLSGINNMKKVVFIFAIMIFAITQLNSQHIQINHFDIDLGIICDLVNDLKTNSSQRPIPPDIVPVPPVKKYKIIPYKVTPTGLIVLRSGKQNTEEKEGQLTFDLKRYSKGALLGAITLGTIGNIAAYHAPTQKLTVFGSNQVDINGSKVNSIMGGILLGAIGSIIGATMEKNRKNKRIEENYDPNKHELF